MLCAARSKRSCCQQRILTPIAIACVWLLVAFAEIGIACGRDIQIGGEQGWTNTGSFDDLNAIVGDRLVFRWEGDQRNVVALPKRSCASTANGVVLAASTDSPATVVLNYTGTFFFSSGVAEECADGSLFAVSVTPEDEPAEAVQGENQAHRGEELEDLIREGQGHCLEPEASPSDSSLMSRACYSPPIALRPGQVEDALYILPNPYPEGVEVGLIKQTLAITDDSNRQVPLSELYLHHVFGPSRLITGEGAEFRGGHDSPPLPHPYYTVVNGSEFASDVSRLVNIHIINTLGVAPEDVPRCIECWCPESNRQQALRGRHGGGACCSDSLCLSSEPSTTVNTYHLQFNVTYRLLEPDTARTPVVSYMMDAVNGSIEYDIVQQPEAPTNQILQSGPMDAMCPQTSSFGLLRCLGHQHIGGRCLRLINQDNGEELCSSCPTYGASGSRSAVGDEDGYLVAMARTTFNPPKQILPGTNVSIESLYDPSQNHFGVMALFFLDLVDFDTSCPGPALPEAELSFGPDYAHHQGTAFGFYAEGFGSVTEGDEALQAEPGDAQGIDETMDPQVIKEKSYFSTPFLAFVCGTSLLLGIAAGVLLETWRRRRHYQPLKQFDRSADTANLPQSHSAGLA